VNPTLDFRGCGGASFNLQVEKVLKVEPEFRIRPEGTR
jgi:hypothetical protein